MAKQKYCDDCEHLVCPVWSEDETCGKADKLVRWNSLKARGFEIPRPAWCPLGDSETGRIFKLSSKYADVMKKYLGGTK